MEPTIQSENKGKSGVIAGIIAGILIVVGGAFAFFKNSGSPTQDQMAVVPVGTTTNTPNIPEQTTPVIVNTKYKNGTYSVEGDYQSPGGAESIAVTLVIKDDVVAEANVVAQATRKESKEYQGKFLSGFKQYVVGKKIDEINVTKVSGSSLTPKGFMDALAKIKLQATA